MCSLFWRLVLERAVVVVGPLQVTTSKVGATLAYKSRHLKF